MTTDRFDSQDELPLELRPIAAAVDDLARAERDSAPATLEDRLYMATRRPLSADAPAIVVRRVGFSWKMRIAATIALAGSVMAVWLGQMSGSGTAGKAARLERDMDLLLSVRTGDDIVSDSLSVLKLETDTVGDSLSPDWPPSFDGGSM